jgi:hypothetical protein
MIELTMSKTEDLKSLLCHINNTIKNAWLFPARDGVSGFMGTARVMVVGERPSVGSAGSPASNLITDGGTVTIEEGKCGNLGGDRLYLALNNFGIADAHLTDLIKTRDWVASNLPDLGPHREVFDREIEIIDPRLIIAFGQKVFDLLQFYLAGRRIKLDKVPHYAYRFCEPGHFQKELQEALNRNK